MKRFYYVIGNMICLLNKVGTKIVYLNNLLKFSIFYFRVVLFYDVNLYFS